MNPYQGSADRFCEIFVDIHVRVHFLLRMNDELLSNVVLLCTSTVLVGDNRNNETCFALESAIEAQIYFNF